MKNVVIIIVLLFFVAPVSGFPGDSVLRLAKTVGNDEFDDYIIFGLADAIITDKKDIFILNAKANNVARYNWNGKFVERIGQKGRGPKDFYFPRSLAYSTNALYILDRGNRRVVEMRLDTNTFNYFNEDPKNQFLGQISIIHQNNFLGVFTSMDENRGRIGIVNQDWNIIKSFFKQTPIDSHLTKTQGKSQTSLEKIARRVITDSYFIPVFHFDEKKDECLISFGNPDNPILFFVTDSNGKELKRFSYHIDDKRYSFPRFVFEYPIDKLRDPNKYPERYVPELDSVFIYKEKYVAFLNLVHYVKSSEKVDNSRLCLIFDRMGNLEKSFAIDKDLRVFRLCQEYVLGTMMDQEVEKLFIYTFD